MRIRWLIPWFFESQIEQVRSVPTPSSRGPQWHWAPVVQTHDFLLNMPCRGSSLFSFSCLYFPGGANGKEPACRCRRHKRWGFNPWSGRSPGRENGNPLQDSCLENPMDRGAWWAIVHRTEHMEPYSQRLPIFFYKLVNFKNITYFMAK